MKQIISCPKCKSTNLSPVSGEGIICLNCGYKGSGKASMPKFS